MKYNGWKFYLRIIAITWILADILTWKISLEWALTIAVPFGLLLLTTMEDKQVKRAQKRPASREA